MTPPQGEFVKKVIATLAIITCLPISAAEVDAFSKRFSPINDSLEQVNILTNQMLTNSLNEANKKTGCDEKRLYKELRKNFNNQYRGELPKEIIRSEAIQKIKTSSDESIYRDFKWWEAIVQGGLSKLSDPIADLMKVNNVLIGTDKFEHFLGSGYRYFKTHYLDNKPIEEALQIGWRAENGILGAITTGVMSYGDLAANFNGMRFWNHMLQKNDDILGAEHNIGPYVTCVDEKWVATEKQIDWANYIDATFDEGINCSRFKDENLSEKVLARLKNLADKNNRVYECPMDPQALDEAAKKYGALAPFLINDHGHNGRGAEGFDGLYPAP